MNLKNIIKNSIDLHVHIGPEIIPRKFDIGELIKLENKNLKGIALKNHFFPTAGMFRTNKKILKIYDSIVLNRYVGGLNPDVIRASAQLSTQRIIVWFPTLHTKRFLSDHKTEIPLEWIGRNLKNKIKLTKAETIKPIVIVDKKGNLTEDTLKVLEAIKKYDCVLATGHLSWKESLKLVSVAVKKYKIRRIIITHPIYQRIKMPVDVQIKLIKLGAFIEHCYSMISIDKISVKKIAEQIRAVGPENCILSSDVGQIFSDSPSQALLEFSNLLLAQSISLPELKKMLCENPNKIIN